MSDYFNRELRRKLARNLRLKGTLPEEDIDIALESRAVEWGLMEPPKTYRDLRAGAPWPWDAYSKQEVRVLCSGQQFDDAVESVVAAKRTKGWSEEDDTAYRRGTQAIAHWLRTGAHVLHISRQAADVLEDVTIDRLQRGTDPIRWSDIPHPGTEHFDVGYMLIWEGEGIVTYGAGQGRFLEERLQFFEWTSLRTGALRQWFDVNAPFDVRHGDFNEVVVAARERAALRNTAFFQELAPYSFFTMTANLLAALNNEVNVNVVAAKSGEVGRRHRRPGEVKPSYIHLDPSGLITWARHVTGREREAGEDRASPKLHYVRQHEARVWVLPENVSQVELVLEEKPGAASPLQQVRRLRSAHARGGEGEGGKTPPELHIRERRVTVEAP